MKKLRTIFAILIIYALVFSANAAQYLIPGGQVIGMELQDNTVTIAAIDEELGNAAKNAGLKEGDQLLKVDGVPIHCAEDVRSALNASRGKISISLMRNGKSRQVSITPAVTPDGPKLGVYLKQGVTGVGTVTYYDPANGDFAALGHGVNTKTGELLHLTAGNIYSAQVQSIKKGAVGTPGQLVGALTKAKAIGSIAKNTAQGVFGTLNSTATATALPTADPDAVCTGAATIRSTVEGSTLREYSVEILKIYPNNTQRSRNMLIKVTDPALLRQPHYPERKAGGRSDPRSRQRPHHGLRHLHRKHVRCGVKIEQT